MGLIDFDRQIKWGPFKKESSRPSTADEDAHIETIYNFTKFKTNRDKNAVKITDVDIKVELVENKCFVVTSKMTDLLLKHEQGHYDIHAIAARELLKKMMSLTATSINDMQSQIQALKVASEAEIDKLNKRYDNVTDHHLKKDVQLTWDAKIDETKKKPDGTLNDLPT